MANRISKVGGGARVPAPQPKPPKTSKEKAAKVITKAEESLKVAAKATSVARSIGTIITTFKDLSLAASKGLKVTKGTSIALTPFNLYHAAEDAVNIVKKKHLKDKIWSVFSLLVNLDTVVDSIAASCGIVYAFKAVSSALVDWIPIYSIVSFFVGFISLGMAAESVGKSGKLVHELRGILKALDKAKTDPERAKILGDFLAKLDAEGVRPLLKKLMISKKATIGGKAVEERIKDLVKLRLSGEKIKEAEHIVRSLAGRAKLDLGFKVAELANKVLAQVGKGFSAFASPLVLVAPIILATSGVVSLVMLGAKLLCISKNPFDVTDVERRSRAARLVKFISNGISHLRDRLHAISLWHEAHPAVP